MGSGTPPQPPNWYWEMEMIDKGFTEKQLYQDFSRVTLIRYQIYSSEKIKANNKAARKQNRGAIGHRSGSKVKTSMKSAHGN